MGGVGTDLGVVAADHGNRTADDTGVDALDQGLGKNGSKIMDKDVLIEQMQFNRLKGTNGEAQFWFDGLYTDYVQEVFRKFYPTKAAFPEF